jgi:DNA-binding NtrC family response regulator
MKPTKLRERLLRLEKTLCIAALRDTQGDVRAASRLLSVPERTLWYRLGGVLELDVEQFRPNAKIA